MQELSLHILDIVQNSIRAEASLIEIGVEKDTKAHLLQITVQDNGCGMTAEQVQKVTDPFFTTRTTRSIGLGVPFLKMTAELTGGSLELESTPGKGTLLRADYQYDHIDMLPLGDMTATVITLLSVNTEPDFVYTYRVDDRKFVFDTREIKQTLDGVAINEHDILAFLKEMLEENTREVETQPNE